MLADLVDGGRSGRIRLKRISGGNHGDAVTDRALATWLQAIDPNEHSDDLAAEWFYLTIRERIDQMRVGRSALQLIP